MNSQTIDDLNRVGPGLWPAPLDVRRTARARRPALHVAVFFVAAHLATACAAHAAAAKPAADNARVSTTLTPDGGRIVVEAHNVPPPAPLFFSANIDQTISLGTAEILGELHIKLHIVQGRPELLSLGLSGDGEITDVAGKGLRDWSVRQDTSGKRFLDLRPLLTEGAPDPRDLDLVAHTRLKKPNVPGGLAVLMATPGDAVGFASKIVLLPDATLDVRVTAATGMAPLVEGDSPTARTPLQFFANGDGRIEVKLAQRGGALAEAELTGAQLSGKVNEIAGSVDFRLRAQARAQKIGARLRLLSGRAAPSENAVGDGWHLELVPLEVGYAYDIVFDRAGLLPLDLAFAAIVHEDGDWHAVNFEMPAGTVVPLRLENLGAGVEFDHEAPVVPAVTPQGAQGFLPSGGAAAFAWKRTRKADEGTLFFTSTEQTDVRVGAGLLRQSSQIAVRILQGKLTSMRLRLDGPGEILGVEGANIAGWKVLPAENARVLDVTLSRPFEGEGTLTVRSQTALGSFPVRAEPMRISPEGVVRHSGFVRVANSGAVRLEVADAEGMLQLAPTQFPGGAVEPGARQIFVYRFPSASYAYRVIANQIQPEVGVSQIVTYELAETDRVINADIEIDVREAPLRDWSLKIPEDYTVVAVNGNDLVDYVAETAATNGYRTLKLLFGRAVDGRQLLRLRLEKNQAAAAGEWTLPALVFPEAKSVRGHIGAISTPGFRIVPARADKLVEVPLSFFPKQSPGLQQAWRLREPDWTAALQIEALGQSVQADVFHLYSLKEGVVYGSVLLNYFVVGAPASEWRIEVPESVGNIDVTGQNVRRDWRREGNQVIVSLHQPVLGAATLLITFEQPMSARGGAIKPGEIHPLGVQGERGFIHVVSPLQVKSQIRAATGSLLKLEPLELPAEFRLLTSSPSLAVYQYTARPFNFEMSIEWYEQSETIDQVVDFAKLKSTISRDGQVVTDARFFVKTRGRKALRMVLPEGMKLWEARVENEIVNARADGEQTLVPLPARMNPNEPVEVALRLGQAAGKSATNVTLSAPRLLVPTVIDEWEMRGDSERLRVATGGNAELTRPALTETGFEWISTRARGKIYMLLALIAGALVFLRATYGWRVPTGLFMCAAAAWVAVSLAVDASNHRRMNLGTLTFASTVVPANEFVSVQVANVVAWRAMISWWGVAASVVGFALVLTALVQLVQRAGMPRLPAAAGAVLFCAGLLSHHGGAVLFFGAIGAAVFLLMPVLGFIRWRDSRRDAGPDDPGASPESGAATTIVSMLAIAGFLGIAFAGAPTARAGELLPDGAKAAQALVQKWTIRENARVAGGESAARLHAEVELTVRGVPGESFLLLNPPAVLTEFNGDGLRVGKVERDDEQYYYVALEREGTLTARAKFELTLGDVSGGIIVPTGPAATQRITIDLDQGGWEFTSTAAVQILPTPGLGEQRSGATLVLAPVDETLIALRPRRRDIAAETTQFFVEASNLYVPGPGVVNGWTRVTVRAAQGRVSELDLQVPEGFTVGDVARGPIGAWRFDPRKRTLHVSVEPAQTQTFQFDIETQRGAGALPVDLALEPLRVVGAAGEVGMLALAFGGDAQPESVRPADLSPVNVEDFDAALLPRTSDGRPIVALQHVWRYGREGGRVELKVASVAPEVRVATRQVFSLDDDRLVLAADLNVSITRVGLFRLSFVLPEGLEVEALSGAALNHWTEAQEGGQRIVTLHLNGRTIGEQAFTLSLAGAAPRAQDAWAVPRLALREATRQTGDLLVVPGKGIRLRAVDRDKVTQLDPRAAGGQQPGTLAFRLLQEDWTLHVGIEALEPWVTVQSLQEVTAREGQTLTRIALRYRVENAAVKQLRVRLPGLGEDQVRTVRATGSAVSDFIKVAGATDGWEIRFQRGIAGETDVLIEFQGQAARDQNRETVATPEFVGARQTVQFVAVRAGGRLELEAGDLPRGWQRVDWSAVPANLQDRNDRSVPAFCFRVAEPESALAVIVRRHEVADALKLRVTQGVLATIFSPGGAFLTAVELKLDVIEKSSLRVRLPEGSRIFNTFVNGESVSVVREGDAYLFYVSPNTGADRSAAVRLVYAVTDTQKRGIALVGPSLSVPLENVSWRVAIPPGYDLANYGGGLRLRDDRTLGWFSVEQYQSLTLSKKSAEARKAVALLEQANVLLQKGEQQQAGEVLARASNARALDEASNEDARVQLRELKTQQAVVGLNTRRQRMYLGNRGDAARNEQLEQAATLNPFMQGKTNFDPKDVDQLLMGNTVEENSALRGIAARLVDQQLAAEPAPGAIDITLPERGRVLTFTRSLQVDGGAPLELTLDIAKISRTSTGFTIVVLLALAAIALIAFPRRAQAQN